MPAIILDTPRPINPAQPAPSPLESFPSHLGMRCWQRALLALAALQLTLPQRAFALPVIALWNEQTLRSILDAYLAPQSAARIITVVQVCGYDALSAYDAIALSTQTGGSLRRPPEERTEKNKAEAFSYGAYRALLDFFPKFEQEIKIRNFMSRLGYDPDDDSIDTTTPAGIGNVAAAAVLASVIKTAPVIWVI